MTRCAVCGKQIGSRQKTCSTTCYARLRDKHVKLWCLICGKPYRARWTRRKKRKYCSRPCYYLSLKKVKRRPSREQLEHLIQELSLRALAGLYGVSRSTVVHWLDEAGIKCPSRVERARLRSEMKKIGRRKGTTVR